VKDVDEIIKKAVDAGLKAGLMQTAKAAGNLYKETEKRLYAYPDLLDKIEDDKARLRELLEGGAVVKSRSVVRFSRSGSRLTPDEILSGIVQDKQAVIAADQHEVEAIAAALAKIEDDPYFIAIKGKFLDGLTDDAIADSVPCDTSTVRRNRGRLVRRLAVLLYGAQAL